MIVVNGNFIANIILERVYDKIKSNLLTPKLSVILVGEDEASKIYIKKKREICRKIGIMSELHEFSSEVTQEEIIDYIRIIGDCPKREVDGIIVQLPLPDHIDKFEVLNAVPSNKDVDCFNRENVGRLAQGNAIFKPCTPLGILEILKYYNIDTKGKKVTIINNSHVIGQPLSVLLSQSPYYATVTVCNQYTEKEVLWMHTLKSDIIITAVGKYPDFNLPDHCVNPGCVVIDVAINRVEGKIFGDILPEDFDLLKKKTSLITPVPGGCGPLTVAFLMRNTLIAALVNKRGIFETDF